jgi:hypothetical protein
MEHGSHLGAGFATSTGFEHPQSGGDAERGEDQVLALIEVGGKLQSEGGVTSYDHLDIAF